MLDVGTDIVSSILTCACARCETYICGMPHGVKGIPVVVTDGGTWVSSSPTDSLDLGPSPMQV
jgi:hypothetical protein